MTLPSLPLFRLSAFKPREVLHQQPVDEDVAATDFAEEDALGALLELNQERRPRIECAE